MAAGTIPDIQVELDDQNSVDNQIGQVLAIATGVIRSFERGDGKNASIANKDSSRQKRVQAEYEFCKNILATYSNFQQDIGLAIAHST